MLFVQNDLCGTRSQCNQLARLRLNCKWMLICVIQWKTQSPFVRKANDPDAISFFLTSWCETKLPVLERRRKLFIRDLQRRTTYTWLSFKSTMTFRFAFEILNKLTKIHCWIGWCGAPFLLILTKPLIIFSSDSSFDILYAKLRRFHRQSFTDLCWSNSKQK